MSDKMYLILGSCGAHEGYQQWPVCVSASKFAVDMVMFKIAEWAEANGGAVDRAIPNELHIEWDSNQGKSGIVPAECPHDLGFSRHESGIAREHRDYGTTYEIREVQWLP